MQNTRIVALGIGVLMALAACSDSDNPVRMVAADAAGTPSTTLTTTTVAPATTLPSASDVTTTTSVMATTTTVAPPATLPTEVLPLPEAPPPADATEPIIEVGTIEIPAIGVSKTMYEGVSLGVLDHGPGHWPGTAEPGQVGNMVIAGHRMSHDRPFRDVDLLVPGDEMFVTDGSGARFAYAVTGTEIVTPDAIRIIEQTPASTATLFACHPKGSTRERIVVHLELVGPA